MNAVLKPQELVIAACPCTMVDLIWDQCVPWLQKVVDRAHGEITLESIKGKVERGDTLLVLVRDQADIIAVITFDVETMESGWKVLSMPIVGGERMDEWGEMLLDEALKVAKAYNCRELRGYAVRDGWLRYMKQHGWEKRHTVMAFKIEE